MTDLVIGAMWLGVLVASLGACIIAHGLGLASTYIRDALHIGAGIWVIGWGYWHGGAIPIAIVVAVALATALLPIVAHHFSPAARLVRSVTNGDEHWAGLVHYTFAYATLTALGLAIDPFPAAAGLLALSLGDGIGGFAGRKLGRHYFRIGSGKRKTLEGSLVVALAASAGVLVAMALFGRDISIATIVGLGALAAITEAVAPRGTDNLLIPAVVWTAATLVT